MMKRLIPFLWVVFCTPLWAGVADDGVISTGEYDYGIVEWTKGYPPLIVAGGGANLIEVRNEGRLEVRYTSIPINGNWDNAGIRDLVLDDHAHLLYLGGYTKALRIDEGGTGVLKNGNIDKIWSRQNTTAKHIDLYCQPGWSWISNDPLTGIEGIWTESGVPFSIEFVNDANYDPAWTNINIITPEPTSVVLLSLGGLLIRKRK